MSEENTKEDEIVTIRDFKSMIVGMDMIMGDNWTPTEDQWKRIRSKINALIETAERPVVNTRNFTGYPVVTNDETSEAALIRSFPGVPISQPGPVNPPSVSALTPPATKVADGSHPPNAFI